MQEVSEGARGEVGGRGEAKGEKVSRVCAHGAAREGRAPQRAAVKAYTGGGGRWWSGCAGGGGHGRGTGDGALGRREGQPRRGGRRVGGGNGRRGKSPRLGSGGRERWRRGACPVGRVSCVCGHWGTWRRGLPCLTRGPRVLCGHGAAGSAGGRNGGVTAGGCVWRGGAEGRPGRAGGGRVGC